MLPTHMPAPAWVQSQHQEPALFRITASNVMHPLLGHDLCDRDGLCLVLSLLEGFGLTPGLCVTV